ncbi:hypothetical protein [Alicyclobacillus ferrooxydans]|uniref:Uncharacterized protein n=1 Tax=Alicyclobacillus ferrooxydans TaxID=471514 RepID=A0A0P9GH09_9BACL|nr:hypothetical protein [Alicyclobacillus ferrooxydans]KPV39308.1 hypothetical protein AN477_22685 [Alicyclobacillus ferrooxydans]
MTNTAQWSLCHISDADEPGDHVLVGMRHRDFDSVLFILLPDGEQSNTDWYGIPRTTGERPTRPVLLFSNGERPSDEALRRWLEEHTEEDSTEFPLPDTFCEPPSQESSSV